MYRVLMLVSAVLNVMVGNPLVIAAVCVALAVLNPLGRGLEDE